jgi:hypothetical protein
MTSKIIHLAAFVLLFGCDMKYKSIPEKSVDIWLSEMGIDASRRSCVNDYPGPISHCTVSTKVGYIPMFINLICKNDGSGCYIRPAVNE